MTSSSRKQIITIHILPNISKTYRHQTMKCSQLKEHNVINLKNHAKNEVGRLALDPFYFLKSFLWGKSKFSSPYFQYIFRLAHTIKANCYNFRLLIQRSVQLYFRKGSGNCFSTSFSIWLVMKMFSFPVFVYLRFGILELRNLVTKP